MNRLSQILFRFVYGLRHEMRYTLFQVFRAFWVRTLFSQCMKFRLEVWNRFVSHSHASVYKKPLNAIVMLHDLLGVRMWKKNVKPNFELYKKFRFCFIVSIHCAVNFYLCESSYWIKIKKNSTPSTEFKPRCIRTKETNPYNWIEWTHKTIQCSNDNNSCNTKYLSIRWY